MMMQLDLKGRIVDVNREWQAVTGFTADELAGQHFYRCIDEYSRQGIRDSYKGIPSRLNTTNRPGRRR